MSTVAEYIVSQLAAWGVRHIYGVVGDTFFPFMDAIAAQGQVRFIPVRHETAAGFMASAEAKLTGRPGVCVATSGPGIANLLNGLGDAYADRVPVLALTGQVESKKLGTNTKQYVDQQALVRPLASSTELLAHPDAIGTLLPGALRTALGENRVAHLSVPKDLWAQPTSAAITPPEPFLGAAPSPTQEVLDGAAALMRAAKRPLILVGQGARPAREAILALADKWGAGILHSMPAIGVVPGTHPLALGGLGAGGTDASHTALQEADLLLTIACNWWPAQFVPEHLPVIKLDRQPIAVGGTMPVRYGVPGLAQEVIPRLHISDEPRTEWRARLHDLKSQWNAKVSQEAAQAGPPMSPQAIVRTLEQALPPDAIIALDTGDHTVWFNRVFEGTRHEVLVSGRWRSLGFGLPAALAAKLCHPERTVVALVGDTGLQSLLGELTTAADLGLPVTVILVNNGLMAIEQNRAKMQGHTLMGTAPNNPDFAAVAQGCGVRGMRANTSAELAEALKVAMSTNRPVLIDAAASSPVAPTSQS